MTDRSELQVILVGKIREHANLLKHNVAAWQLLDAAGDEIERLQSMIKGAEIALARDENIDAAMRCLLGKAG